MTPERAKYLYSIDSFERVLRQEIKFLKEQIKLSKANESYLTLLLAREV